MLVIRPLAVEDAALLAQLLASQADDYLQYFQPFAFDTATIEQHLAARRRDCWMGIWGPSGLLGFFMLRGLDEGYETPAFGVAIAAEARGLGIGRLAVVASKSLCRLIGARRLMLKVHPDNRVARQLYESEGFVQSGVDERNQNLIYHFEVLAGQPS